MNQSDPDRELHELFQRHRSELTHTMSPGLRSRLAPTHGRRTQVTWRVWLRFASAVAACVALVAAFQLGGWLSRPTRDSMIVQEVVAGHVRSLMADHLVDVASTDHHTVKPWFEGKLDFAPTVRDLAAEGFPLVGGRVDYVDGRTVAAVIYKRNQHVINVYEWPTAEASDTRPRLQVRRGFQILSWRHAGLETWVVSDLNAIELQQLSESLAGP